MCGFDKAGGSPICRAEPGRSPVRRLHRQAEKGATVLGALCGGELLVIIDARSVPSGTILDTEVCIVGAGAAGITLAREFIAAPFRVVLLESGGMHYDQETQDLYEGQSVGRTFEDLTLSRLRYFGGTTNHWGGWCLPFDAIDFEPRDDLP